MAESVDRDRTAVNYRSQRSWIAGLKSLALWLAPLAFLCLFYFYPLGSILVTSFERAGEGVFRPFVDAIQSSAIRNVLLFTIGQALLSTFLTLLIGLPGAYLADLILQSLGLVALLGPLLLLAWGTQLMRRHAAHQRLQFVQQGRYSLPARQGQHQIDFTSLRQCL